MKIDLKSLLKQSNNILSFDLPNGDVLTAYEDLDGNLIMNRRSGLGGDSFNVLDLRGVMKPSVYEDGVYVFHTDSGVNKDNFKETYDKYKEKNQLGGYRKFCATYNGSAEYLKGIVDAIWLTDHLDHIEVKDGKII